jgi:hypothetical protein
MARVTLYDGAFTEGYGYFYNVDEAVGPNAPNRRDDVLLVQYFLKVAYDHAHDLKRPLVPPPGRPLVVDGIAGLTTFQWISHFQNEAKPRGNRIATDGQVDKARGLVFATLSKTQYTITFLNDLYRRFRQNDYRNIAKAADCPRDLAAAVSLR